MHQLGYWVKVERAAWTRVGQSRLKVETPKSCCSYRLIPCLASLAYKMGVRLQLEAISCVDSVASKQKPLHLQRVTVRYFLWVSFAYCSNYAENESMFQIVYRAVFAFN